MFNKRKSFLLLYGVAFLIFFVYMAEEAKTSSIQFSGAIEAEAGILIAQEDKTTTESELGLATVELGIDSELSDNVEAHLMLLYEEGENDSIAIDEGTITLKNIYGTPLAITVGRLYVPFGEFNSHFVTDPFTLEIAETNKTVLQFSIEHQFLAASLALFKSGVVAANDENNHINNFATHISATTPEDMLGEGISLAAGTSLVKNFADTDGIGEVIGVNFGTAKLDNIPLGIGVFAIIGLYGTFLEGEFITSRDDFSGKTATDKAFESKPWALNAEIGYTLENLPIPVEVAAKFERLHQSGDANINRFGGVISAGLFGKTAGAVLEFLRIDTDDESDIENTLAFQLSARF